MSNHSDILISKLSPNELIVNDSVIAVILIYEKSIPKSEWFQKMELCWKIQTKKHRFNIKLIFNNNADFYESWEITIEDNSKTAFLRKSLY